MTRAKLFTWVAALVIAGTGGCNSEQDQTKLYNQAFAGALATEGAVPPGTTAKITTTITSVKNTVNGKLAWKVTWTCTGDSIEEKNMCKTGPEAPGGGKCTNTAEGSTCTWSG
jgi:hypothetical protein